MAECGEGSRHSRWRETEGGGGGEGGVESREEMEVGREEQVGLKQSPRQCDLCRPVSTRINHTEIAGNCVTGGWRVFTWLAQGGGCRCRGRL